LRNRRSPLQIIADILRLLRLGEAGKTEIMYTVNLSYSLRQKYIGNLLELDLLEECHEGRHSVNYRITRKGLNVLTAIENMQEMLRLEEVPDILNSPYIAKASSRGSRTI